MRDALHIDQRQGALCDGPHKRAPQLQPPTCTRGIQAPVISMPLTLMPIHQIWAQPRRLGMATVAGI